MYCFKMSSTPYDHFQLLTFSNLQLLYIKIFTIFGLTWSLEPVGTVLESLGLTGCYDFPHTFVGVLNRDQSDQSQNFMD